MSFARRVTIGRKLGLFVCVLLVLLGALAWGVLSGLGRLQLLEASAAEAAAARRTLEGGSGALDAMHAASALLALEQTAAQVTRTQADVGRLEGRAREALLGQVAQQTDSAAAASLRHAAQAIGADAAAIKALAQARLALLDLRDRALLPALPHFEETVHETLSELDMGSMAPAAAAEEQARLTHYAGAVTDGAQAALRFVNTQDPDDSHAAAMGAAIANALLGAARKTALPETAQANFVSMTRHGAAVMQLTATLVARTTALQDMLHGSVRAADAAASRALGSVQDAFTARAEAARAQASASAQRTRRDLLGLCLLILGLTVAAGVLLARTIARPMRAMTQALCRMAEGDTSAPIGHRGRRDEIGEMAAALETLRGVVAHAFVQGQMIEQMPVGVMMADQRQGLRIVYVNAALREIMAPVEDALPVPAAALVGSGLDVLDLGIADQRDSLADPARLPLRARIRLGRETMDLRVSAIHDRDGSYRGPMIAWSRATGQVELAERFEDSVASIVGSLGSSAETMRGTAAAMDGNAADSVARAAAMAAAAGQASANVRAVEDNATALAASIREIALQVSESARMASQAVTEAQATDRSVAGLNTAASRIGDVVQLIGDIAARTNLLALNATIEAARAGDAGRGFAVVASEVKTLANQTARATEEVASQIAAMQAETGRAVEALHAIGASIKRLDEIAASIAAAVEEQGAATGEIARAVQQASAGTSEVSGNIGAVSDAMQQTRAQSGAVLEAAGLLAAQSGALKEGVDRFLSAMREAG